MKKRLRFVLFSLLLTGCLSVESINLERAEISSVGPVVKVGNYCVLVVTSKKRPFYKLESISGDTIVFSSFLQGNSPVTYAQLGGPVIEGAERKLYQIKYKNPDGSLVELGSVNFAKQIDGKEYYWSNLEPTP